MEYFEYLESTILKYVFSVGRKSHVYVSLCLMGDYYANFIQLISVRHVKMSFIFGKQYFTFPVSQKGQISFPFPPWQKGQLYFSRYFSCTIFNKKSTASSADLGLKSVEVLVFLKVLT